MLHTAVAFGGVLWKRCICTILINTIFVLEITGVKFINTSGNPGPVQVEYEGEWHLICTSRDWDYTREALVMCRQLGYIGGWQRSFAAGNPLGIGFDGCDGMFLQCRM